eukprot:scaffold6591_cov112-Skeletonema_dohrnii-CCMP3373.AAC.1
MSVSKSAPKPAKRCINDAVARRKAVTQQYHISEMLSLWTFPRGKRISYKTSNVGNSTKNCHLPIT